MRAWINTTDWDWFKFLSLQPDLDEINFWQAGGKQRFARLKPGELFLFKLHSPQNFIVGGGVFAYSTIIPVSLAWQSFEKKNGAGSLAELRAAIEPRRKGPVDTREDYKIGCVILTQPFFLPKSRWVRYERDWPRIAYGGIQSDLTVEPGRTLYQHLRGALAGSVFTRDQPILVRDLPADPGVRYGSPVLITPRLGQGAFRMVVTDAYDRRCAITGEKVLPVLEAAHIRPFKREGPHRVQNGILLRSDLHTLFDGGYLTVNPDFRLEVSHRLHEEFDNGKHYYSLTGQRLRAPLQPDQSPAADFLSWHNENVYLG